MIGFTPLGAPGLLRLGDKVRYIAKCGRCPAINDAYVVRVHSDDEVSIRRVQHYSWLTKKQADLELVERAHS